MTVLTHPTAARTRTDSELVADTRRGGAASFDAIVARYEAPLTAWARHVLHGAHHDAEEVVQDVLIRALAALRRDSRDIVLKPWLFAICRNACLDRLRADRGRVTSDLAHYTPVLGDPAADPHLQAVRRETLAELVGDLGRLPTRQRLALVGRELEGRTHEQLAAGLGVSVGASKALVCRARRGLADGRAAA